MIEQCLLNKNESATVSKSKKVLDLNKASVVFFQVPFSNDKSTAKTIQRTGRKALGTTGRTTWTTVDEEYGRIAGHQNDEMATV